MLNVVTGPEGCGSAVLIRGAGNAQGPGRLGRALALTPDVNGKAATPETGLWFEERDVLPRRIVAGPRIGVDYAGPKWSRRKLRFMLQRKNSTLARPVALIALPGLCRGFRLHAPVLRERTADIIALLDTPLVVAPYVALVALVRLDEFAFSRHMNSLRCTPTMRLARLVHKA